MNFKNLKGALLLLTASLIWGTAFVAQKMGGEVGAFTFLASRSYIGFIFILAFIFIVSKTRKNLKVPEKTDHNYIKYGLICGVIMFGAAAMQQIGMNYTDAGKAGFLTALYIVIVPVLGMFFKRKVPTLVWISIVIAGVGAYLLTVKSGFSIEQGDTYIIVSAFLFSLHIIAIDLFAPKTDAIKLSCTQFLSCAIVSTIASFIFENPNLPAILEAGLPILYCGVMSSGIAFTLQIVGQKNTPPSVAALIMSLESIFAVLAGVLILGEVLAPREILGCVLTFTAVILAQVPDMFSQKQKI